MVAFLSSVCGRRRGVPSRRMVKEMGPWAGADARDPATGRPAVHRPGRHPHRLSDLVDIDEVRMPAWPVGRIGPRTPECSSERSASDRCGLGPYVRRARRSVAILCDRLEEPLQHRVEQLG